MTVSTTPHDALFRALVDDPGRAGALIRDYLPEPIARRLADGPPELIDGSYIDEELRESRSDRLFSVTLKGGRKVLLYILIEHKSSPDPRTPLQLLGYRVRIWERWAGKDPAKLRCLPPIIPLVFYHGLARWQVPTSILDCLDIDGDLAEELQGFDYVLCDLGPIPDDRLSSDREVRSGLLVLKHVFRDADLEVLLETVLAGLPDGTLFEVQVIRYILLTYRHLTPQLWTKVAQQVKPDREKEMISIAAEEWLKQAKFEGWAEGKAQGIAEGKAEDILIALETRFGPVSPEIQARIRRSAPEQLDGLFRRSLTASSLDGVFADVDDLQH
jgi:predicted transposase YdaD